MNESESDGFGALAAPVKDGLPEESEEPPGSSRRHPHWRDVPPELWEDWRWQMHNALRTTRQVAELLSFSPQEIPLLESLEAQYKLAIPPYYFSLIDPRDPADPIRLQAIPSISELSSQAGQELEDPLEEDKDSPVPGLTHRYPDRVLLVTTPVCSMYCRFCTRKRVTMDRDGWDAPTRDEERMIEYVRDHPEVHDVIVSGGDPLMLPPAKLRWFVGELAAIRHVDVIRIGTRVPVTLPQKLFERELVELLGQAGKIWIQTHFNHPVEVTPEAARACRNLVNAGMPVSNHSVLLKGVNDSVATMRALVRALLRIKVRPYYVFHCDPVIGAGHFRTTVWKGLEIIEGLRGHVSGLGVPTYVVDGLHGAGKIPLMPNYLVSASENAVVLRNYEGLLFRYAPEDRAGAVPEGIASVGVSNLLSGNAKVLIPEGNARMARRQQAAVSRRASRRNRSSNGRGKLGASADTNGNGIQKPGRKRAAGPALDVKPPTRRLRKGPTL
ncbi:MAG: KamA family radical SAM protein [Planctomycetes bacterium]|nr:KamA family radical SAM protein [Planctomycetota bacterium]